VVAVAPTQEKLLEMVELVEEVEAQVVALQQQVQAEVVH
jgi:hypothetical protein